MRRLFRTIRTICLPLLLAVILHGYYGPIARCDQCLCLDDAAGETIVVDDLAMRRSLCAQAAALIQRKRTAKIDELIEQLSQDRCDIELPEPRAIADGLVEVFRAARDAVVVVAGIRTCPKCEKPHLAASTATGFVIAPTGIVVTNHHVVDNQENEALVVMTADRRVFAVQRVLAADEANDLAILEIDAKGLKSLPIAPPGTTPVGTPVCVISHPAGRFYTFTSGVVSRHMKIRNKEKTTDAIAITADYARGSSGAPVMNHRGQVVAIVKSTESIGAVHHSKDGEDHENVQMVFKVCIPSEGILKLIGGSDESE